MPTNQKYPVPVEMKVKLTLSATVKITQEVLDGIEKEYPVLWEESKDDPECAAKAMLYASMNRLIPLSNDYYSDIWDQVGEMQGLIRHVELY